MDQATAIDEVRDGHRSFDGVQRPGDRLTPLTVGVVVWLVSELMFFGGLFAAWFVLRANNAPDWPPVGQELDPARMAIGTAILITSSGTIELCLRAGHRGDRRRAITWLLVTIGLGLAFLANEIGEWATLGFGFDASAFSTIFYLLTGFHGAHVLGGIVIMTIVGWVALSHASKIQVGEPMRVTSYYWHFVDVVWILLFVIVYLIQ